MSEITQNPQTPNDKKEPKKPFYKKAWFSIICMMFLLGFIVVSCGTVAVATWSVIANVTEEIVEEVDDDTYNNPFIETIPSDEETAIEEAYPNYEVIATYVTHVTPYISDVYEYIQYLQQVIMFDDNGYMIFAEEFWSPENLTNIETLKSLCNSVINIDPILIPEGFENIHNELALSAKDMLTALDFLSQGASTDQDSIQKHLEFVVSSVEHLGKALELYNNNDYL